MLRFVRAIKEWLTPPRSFALVEFEENTIFFQAADRSLEELDQGILHLRNTELGQSAGDDNLFTKTGRTIHCGRLLCALIHQHGRDVDRMIQDNTNRLAESVVGYLPPDSANDATPFQRTLRQITTKIPDLLYRDLVALRNGGAWSKQPGTLFWTIILTSIAAAVQGWDQTGSNGANLIWPEIFGVDVKGCETANPPDGCSTRTLIVGLVNSAPYIMIFLGFWISEPLNYHVGRRRSIFFAAIFGIIAPLLSTKARSWGALFGIRLLLGIGMGIKEVTVPIFAAEIAPPEIRGALVMSWQLWTAFGILAGSIANIVALDIADDLNTVWKYQLGSAFIPAVPLLLLIMTVPESPRWLILKGRHPEAYYSLKRLRGREMLLVIREFLYLENSIQRPADVRSEYGRFTFIKLGTLLNKRRKRNALVAACIVMASQQLCGINILSFYSSNIFSQLVAPEATAKGKIRQALLLTLGFGIINFVLGWLAFLTIDRYGRRRLLLNTFPIMAGCLLLAGIFYQHPKVVTVFIYFFAAAYSPGPGPIAFTYSAEVFRIEDREAGMGWAVAINNLFASILSIFFLRMLWYFPPRGTGAFEFFAGMNLLATFLVLFLVPETKQRTLEGLHEIFDHPVGKYITQGKEDLQWIAGIRTKPTLYDLPRDYLNTPAPAPAPAPE